MGAGAGPEDDPLTGDRPVVDDDRSRPTSELNELTPSASIGSVEGASQTASFTVGALQVEFTAAPGAARLVVSADGIRDIYVVDPHALAAWAADIGKLMSIGPAADESHRADYRAPFLVDREGRQSVALEALVTEHGVGYRLLVTGAAGRLAGIMMTAELVREIADAAAGAAVFATAPVRP
jgi:hypothetical protein